MTDGTAAEAVNELILGPIALASGRVGYACPGWRLAGLAVRARARTSRQGSRSVRKRRRTWFEPMTQAYTALWWIHRGTAPAIAEAEDRVRSLRAHGPTPHAFTLRVHFPPPGDTGRGARAGRDDWMCPA